MSRWNFEQVLAIADDLIIWTRSEMRINIHKNSGIFRSPKESILANLDFDGPIFGYKVYKGMINDICQLKFKYLL